MDEARLCSEAISSLIHPIEEQSGMEEQSKTKRTKLMRFWIFGIFIIVFAAITAYISLWTQQGIVAAIMTGWPIWVITLVAGLLIYFGYQYLYLKRQ
jgi:NADH:ubiquinone oxidoreductase subunit 3 (subunit A)